LEGGAEEVVVTDSDDKFDSKPFPSPVFPPWLTVS